MIRSPAGLEDIQDHGGIQCPCGSANSSDRHDRTPIGCFARGPLRTRTIHNPFNLENPGDSPHGGDDVSRLTARMILKLTQKPAGWSEKRAFR